MSSTAVEQEASMPVVDSDTSRAAAANSSDSATADPSTTNISLPHRDSQLSQLDTNPQQTSPESNSNAAATAYTLPPPAELRRIEERQEAKAKEIRELRSQQRKRQQASLSARDTERDDAAQLIQKNYRGYRARRELKGFGVDPGMRWVELMKEAKYQSHTQPLSREARGTMSPSGDRQVRDRWRRIGTITHHAGSDDTSEEGTDGDEDTRAQLERKKSDKAEREKYAKVMGLEYFLEMVDHKHRYGSNLRRYHVEWKKSSTNENFFYWLDYGEGKDLDLEDRPRKRLDTEQVRYLSREERQRYLVEVRDGQLIWAKNGEAITTSTGFRDSINGIVPADSDTPTWREVTTGQKPEPSPPDASSDADSASGLSTGSEEDPSKYMNTHFHGTDGSATNNTSKTHALAQKLNHSTVDAVMNHMLRKTTKSNTWIFVADTSFRMYVGIKQSGAFQHSSFLRGARVSAAGLIKIKNGQLRKLSPLSGHYAPPLKNFRGFIRNLKDAGADLSRVSISRSYAVLLGLEGYLGAKKKVEGVERGFMDTIHPEKKREREEKEMDNSRSAQREREVLRAQEKERRSKSRTWQMLRRLGLEEHLDGEGGDGGTARGTAGAIAGGGEEMGKKEKE